MAIWLTLMLWALEFPWINVKIFSKGHLMERWQQKQKYKHFGSRYFDSVFLLCQCSPLEYHYIAVCLYNIKKMCCLFVTTQLWSVVKVPGTHDTVWLDCLWQWSAVDICFLGVLYPSSSHPHVLIPPPVSQGDLLRSKFSQSLPVPVGEPFLCLCGALLWHVD